MYMLCLPKRLLKMRGTSSAGEIRLATVSLRRSALFFFTVHFQSRKVLESAIEQAAIEG